MMSNEDKIDGFVINISDFIEENKNDIETILNKNKTSKKLTPAQKRDLKFQVLLESIKDEDVDTVNNIISDEKLDWSKCPYNLFTEIFKYFNEDIVNEVLNHKFNNENFKKRSLHWGSVVSECIKNRNIDVIKYIAKIYNNNLLDPQSIKNICNTLLSTNHYEGKENIKFRKNQYLYRKIFRETDSNFFKNYYTENKFNLYYSFKAISGSLSIGEDIENNYLNDELNILENSDNLDKLFKFSSNYISENVGNGSKIDMGFFRNKWSLNKLILFTKILNKSEKIKKAWNEKNKRLLVIHNDFNNYMKQWIKDDCNNLNESHFIKTLLNYKYDNKSKENKSNYKKETIKKWLDNPEKSVKRYIDPNNLHQGLGLPWDILLKVNINHIISRLYLNSDLVEHKDTHKNIFKDHEVLDYLPKDFFHHLVNTASPILLTLSKDKKIKEKIKDCLSDNITLYMFSQNIIIDNLIKLLKQMPDLKDWRDKNNNTLGHYYAIIQKRDTKSDMTKLYRIVPEWFNVKNHNSKSLLDIFKDNGADDKYLMEVKHKILSDTLKEDEKIGKKIKNKAKVKRKM